MPTTLSGKKFLLISNLTLPWCSLSPSSYHSVPGRRAQSPPHFSLLVPWFLWREIQGQGLGGTCCWLCWIPDWDDWRTKSCMDFVDYISLSFINKISCNLTDKHDEAQHACMTCSVLNLLESTASKCGWKGGMVVSWDSALASFQSP